MNEEIDETEFYHQDFTTATEWEMFIARMEEIINQWKTEDETDDDQLNSNSKWITKHEKIPFADVEFNLHIFKERTELENLLDENDDQLKSNPMDSMFDFKMLDDNDSTSQSCLASWYGLSQFILLTPVGDSGVTNESRIKVLLSSVYIVSSSTNCEIPIFVQIREKWQKCFLGVYEGNGIRTNFEMVHLKRGPQHCQYLTGLIDLFKNKVMSPVLLENITVSVQLSYFLTDFGTYVWQQELGEGDSIDKRQLTIFPFGVCIDPITSIVLKATWSHLPEHLIVDSESYSDLDPMQAPKWSCLVYAAKDAECLLADGLIEFYQLLMNATHTVYDILGDYASAPSLDSTNPLDVLTEPVVPTISTILNRAARSSLVLKVRKGNAPIKESILVPILYFLFPDADESLAHPYGLKENNELDTQEKGKQPSGESFINLDHECRGFKTCGSDSLLWRLSIVLMHSLQSLGGIDAFAHIWYEFVQEMRYRWEKSMTIPGLTPGYPDLRTCLLNQKLQMLNCCIERRRARENLHASNFDSAENSSADEDDEFFDCSEKLHEEKKKEKISLWNQPVGRLGKFGNLKLLETGDPLYIPITQEPVPKTEDQLEEDTDVLLKLGCDAEASELRAKMMSASLLSDMESFKAANPGSIVEDFIRWYSPRDWIEDEELDEWGQKMGHLSPRMLIENNNIWVQMWESSKPVPANRQKRLFDDTREAEKVLQFLDHRNISQICELIIPILCHGAIYRLVDECESIAKCLPEISTRVINLLKHTERMSREVKLQQRRFDAFIQEVSALELLISQTKSLQYKFNPSRPVDNVDGLDELIGNLVMGREIEVENKSNSIIGGRILSMFNDVLKSANLISSGGEQYSGDDSYKSLQYQQGNVVVFPQPWEREFVMRVSAVKPASYSCRCPQFLRAVLSRNSFRLAGAFSEDIVFF